MSLGYARSVQLSRRCIDLVREDAHGDRDRDVLDGEERQLVLPVEARRGDRRVRQPVERDVVEDVVAREALGLSVEDAGDELVAAHVVVEHPGREADGRIRDPVERLRAVRHLEGVAEAVSCRRSPAGRTRAVRRPRGRTGRAAVLQRLGDVGRNGRRHVDVNAEQLRRGEQGHLLRDGIAPVAALRDELRVAEALHQHDPGPRDADRIPAELGRLAGKAVARQRRDHDVERVRCIAAVRGRVGQRLDDLRAAR